MPRCKICGSILRPDIVLFGEYEDPKVEWTIKSALRECDLFISVGTSGTVAPASNLVRSAQYSGARTVYINLEPMIPPNPYFQETVIGKAEDILQTLINQ
jgi:NAD-dependent deacetylase